MRVAQDANVDQRGAAVRFIEAVIRDANFMADLTAAFLKAQGFHRVTRTNQSGDGLPADGPIARQAENFLLNLAAALRLARWEQSALRLYLPSSLPSSKEAFRNLVLPVEREPPPDGRKRATSLSLDVFRTWVERFCRGGQAELGSDVVLKSSGLSAEALLDALADFLWDHRHLGRLEEKQP